MNLSHCSATLLGLSSAQAIDRAWGLIALDWDVSLRLAVTVGVVDGSNPNPTSSTGMAGRTNSRVVGGDNGGIRFPQDVINGSISGSQRVGNGNSDTGFGGSPLAEIEAFSDVLVLNHGGSRACSVQYGQDGGSHGVKQEYFAERRE